MDSLAWCQLSSAVVWFGTDRGAAIGQVMYNAVLLDGDDGADPGAALRRLCRAGAEGLGDVGRWVLDGADRVLPDAFAKHAVARAEVALIGSVDDEVALAALLAGV
jgi:hypothetical protein